MLKYIVNVTEDLVPTCILVCLLFAWCTMRFCARGRRAQRIGLILGLVASAAMAIAKNVTSKIATNRWNMYIFYIAIIASLVFVLFSLFFIKGEPGESMSFPEVILHIAGAVLTAMLVFYETPDVMAYPFLFDTGGAGVWSVAFLLRLIGWLLGLLLIFVFTRFLYRASLALGNRGVVLVALDLAVLFNAARFVGLVLSKWLARPKWLTWPKFSSKDHPWAFPYAKFVSNHTLLFIILIAAAAMLIPVILFIRSLHLTEPYDNPAQRRKLIARNRRFRRWSVVLAACFAISVVNLTAIRAYDNRVIELSPPETYEVDGDRVSIDLTQVEDGHLHRFEYTTDSGTDVRWIVIKKPGAAAYGVGLDACSVCGDAGYFERGGQVVCKRCDVVMNINTIGFKGGCNPIPLEYRVENGKMLFSLQDIIDGEKNFK